MLSVIAVIAAACGSNESENEGEAKEKETVTVEHELGETEVEKNPKKVVVFDFGALDTIDELDVEVAGVPQNNMPTYLDKYESDEYESVGRLKEPDYEEIAEIDPGVMLISGRQSDLYEQLGELAPTVYVGVDTSEYMDSFKANVGKIGEIFDKEEEADAGLVEVVEKIEAVQEDDEESDKDGIIFLDIEHKLSTYGLETRFG